MRILHKTVLGQVEPSIRRDRGRPPKAKQVLASLDKEALKQVVPTIRRGRGRPPKNCDQKVAKPLVDVLSNKIFKKPRSRSRIVGANFQGNVPCSPSDCFGYEPLSKIEVLGTIPDFDTSKSFVDKETNPTLLSNCVCYRPLSEIEIPGPIPNFDPWELKLDDQVLSDFFEGIPDISSAGGWCEFCRQ